MLTVMLQSGQKLRRLPNRPHTKLLAQRLELAARKTIEISVGVLLHSVFCGRIAAAVRAPRPALSVLSLACEA